MENIAEDLRGHDKKFKEANKAEMDDHQLQLIHNVFGARKLLNDN